MRAMVRLGWKEIFLRPIYAMSIVAQPYALVLNAILAGWRVCFRLLAQIRAAVVRLPALRLTPMTS